MTGEEQAWRAERAQAERMIGDLERRVGDLERTVGELRRALRDGRGGGEDAQRRPKLSAEDAARVQDRRRRDYEHTQRTGIARTDQDARSSGSARDSVSGDGRPDRRP